MAGLRVQEARNKFYNRRDGTIRDQAKRAQSRLLRFTPRSDHIHFPFPIEELNYNWPSVIQDTSTRFGSHSRQK
jgi:hypothetical protein